jgi:hypothetical protein
MDGKLESDVKVQDIENPHQNKSLKKVHNAVRNLVFYEKEATPEKDESYQLQ